MRTRVCTGSTRDAVHLGGTGATHIPGQGREWSPATLDDTPRKEVRMGMYERLGVRRVINATCHHTVYGGSVMWPEVLDALADARRACVDMRQLLDAAT